MVSYQLSQSTYLFVNLWNFSNVIIISYCSGKVCHWRLRYTEQHNEQFVSKRRKGGASDTISFFLGWLLEFVFFFFIEYNCSIVDKCQNFQINVALYKSSLQNAAMLDITIVPCVARTNIFSSQLLCCEFSCRDDAVCIYSNRLPTGADVLQTFCFSEYVMWWRLGETNISIIKLNHSSSCLDK